MDKIASNPLVVALVITITITLVIWLYITCSTKDLLKIFITTGIITTGGLLVHQHYSDEVRGGDREETMELISGATEFTAPVVKVANKEIPIIEPVTLE